MNKLKSTRIYGDLYIDGLAKVNSNDIITTTNLSSTIQTVSPNSLTTKENRSYSIQRNASGQLVVNIPWTDTTTNWYPTSFSWTNGTANGPVGSLTGTGMPSVSIGAIPAASNEASGIVTTGEQTFKGAKTFTDNVTLSGDLTVLGAMNVKNVNVLETSSGIIFEGGSGSGKVTMELATDPGTTSYSLKVPNKNGTIATDDIMTNTTPGLGKVFSNTTQTVAANSVSSTASRTYGIQKNSSGQLVVNVPWVDNNNTYSAGDGLTLSGSTFSLPVSTSGTGTFVTGITQLTNGIQVNLGTPPNTNTHWDSKNVVGGSSTASTDGTSTNGNTYINHIESGLSSPTSSHNIVGTGATTVTSDANGKITIHSLNTNTNNYLTGVTGSGNGTVTFTRNGLSDLTWDASHTHTIAQVTGLQAELNEKAATGQVVRATTENKNILGTTEEVFNISEKKVWFNKGALFFGTAADAGLVTRGISGTSSTGSTKDHLYINYDGNNTLSRQLVLGAGSIGTDRGNGIYDYSAVRGDAFIAYLNAQLDTISLTPGPKGDDGTNATISGATATVSNTVGTPSVTVSSGGTSSNRSFAFTFTNLKGEKGDPGQAATVSVGTTTTSASGGNASVTQSGNAQNRTFNFVIPRGEQGEKGTASLNSIDVRGDNTPGSQWDLIPADMDNRSITSYFSQFPASDGMGTSWKGLLNIKGWSGSTYASWQLIGPASTTGTDEGLFYRTGNSTSGWSTPRKIFHSGNLTAGDIPNLPTSKITSGRFIKDRLPTDTVYTAGLSSYTKISDIVNNFTSTDTNKPLSANQGKVLNDTTAKLAVSNVFTQPQIVPNAENDNEAVNLGQLNTVVSIWRYE